MERKAGVACGQLGKIRRTRPFAPFISTTVVETQLKRRGWCVECCTVVASDRTERHSDDDDASGASRRQPTRERTYRDGGELKPAA